MAGGKTEVLFSGYATTNSLIYRNIDVLGYGEVAIVPHCVTGGTSLFNIRGYPTLIGGINISGTSITLISGSLGSGQMGQYSVTDAFEAIEVGIASNASNTTGVVNVYVSRKRRQ